MCTVYETSVAKMIFNNNAMEQLTILDPRNRDKTSINGLFSWQTNLCVFLPMKWILCLWNFMIIMLQPWIKCLAFDPKEAGAIDHFWTGMAKVHSIMDSEVFQFSVLAQLAQVLLVLPLPHSNADPEHLFSMVKD